MSQYSSTFDAFVKAPKRMDVISMFVFTSIMAIVAVVHGIAVGYSSLLWWMFAVFASLNNLAITTGYHRLWSHGSFKAPAVVRFLFAMGGAFAFQNSILKWAADHRRHHRYVDNVDMDPYSANRGFWFSHMGWMLRDYPSAKLDFSNVPDLQRDPIVRFQHRYYLPLAIGLNVGIPMAIGWGAGDVWGALLLVGFLRLVVCHHTTFFINSLAHIWGRQPYSSKNTAKDNPIIALLTFGEGYHNFHHAHPGDYRNAIRWWQWDPTKWLIRGLWMLGLASDLKTTTPQKIEASKSAGRLSIPTDSL